MRPDTTNIVKYQLNYFEFVYRETEIRKRLKKGKSTFRIQFLEFKKHSKK